MSRAVPVVGFLLVVGSGWYWWRAQKKTSQGQGRLTIGAPDFGVSNTFNIGEPGEGSTMQLPDTRGFRNNNPGNIEYNPANNWVGQTGSDGRYAIFSKMRFGIRAIGKLLDTYHNRHGLNTIRGIVSRWAPHNENDTAAYIESVAQYTGFGVDDPLYFGSADDKALLVNAIIRHENGQDLPFTLVNEGLALP